MHIDSIRYFIELAESGSFYAAAKKLYISAPGLNKAITSLEDNLGLKLVERSRDGIRLTRYGEVYLEGAKEIYAAYQNTLTELYREEAFLQPKEVRINLFATYYMAHVLSCLSDTVGLFETCNVMERPFDKLGGLLEESEDCVALVDLNPATHAELAKNDQFVFWPFAETRKGVVFCEGSPLEGQDVIHRTRLSKITLGRNSNVEMTKAFDVALENPDWFKFGMSTTNTTLLMEYAKSSPDVAVLFDSFAFKLLSMDPKIPMEGLSFVPLATPLAISTIGAVRPKGRRVDKRMNTFLQEFHKQVKEVGQSQPGPVN